MGYIYGGDAVHSKEIVNKSLTVTEYFPSCSPGARFPHLWLNSSKTLSSHSLLDYTKWTLLTLNSDPVLTDFNLSILKSIPIQLTSISDLNLESEYQNLYWNSQRFILKKLLWLDQMVILLLKLKP